MTLDSIIRVTATIDPSDASGEEFGRSLFMYTGDASGTTRAAIAGDRARDLRVNRYDTLAEVEEEFEDNDHEVYKAAAAYFQQTTTPKTLIVAGWHAAGAVSYILGATGIDSTDVDAIKALGQSVFTAAGESVTVDLNVSGTGDTALGNVATAIQAMLRTITAPDLSGVTVTYDDAADAFQVTAPIGVDLGGVLGGAGAEGVGLGSTARHYPGVPVETITQAVERVQRSDDTWHWIVAAADIVASDHVVTLATWLQNEKKQGVFAVRGASVLVANDATSRAAQIAALDGGEYERNTLIWSGAADYKDASIAALFSGTDFTALDSLPTLHGRTLPGRTADVLTSAQRRELERKRINYYETVAGHAIVRQGGTVRSGWWVDTRYWLDWFIQRVQTDLYALLRRRPRVPLTARGMGEIQAVIENVCADGRRNGGIAPGTVSNAIANDIRRLVSADFNGRLSRGFLVHIAALSTLTDEQRANRKTPQINVWLTGAGAAHDLDIAVSFSD